MTGRADETKIVLPSHGTHHVFGRQVVCTVRLPGPDQDQRGDREEPIPNRSLKCLAPQGCRVGGMRVAVRGLAHEARSYLLSAFCTVIVESSARMGSELHLAPDDRRPKMLD
jgi:hypothetical protein